MADLRIDLAAEFKGKKAFKEADKAIFGLDKKVIQLGKSLGLVLGVSAMKAYGTAAVKAFAADEAAANRLATAVDNLGLSFSQTRVTDFIANLERSAGIADDVLRPAFQALLTTTGSLTKSQILLNNAIQISRASGIDLATVSQDLANGYVGITRGLKKYNTGLTQAELKSKSFSEILGVMLTRSAGAADAYLTSTSYKLDVLTVAADNAKETIGSGLVDAFAKIGGGSTAADAAKTIDTIAKSINAMTQGVGLAVGAVVKLYRAFDYIGSLGGLLGENGALFKQFENKPSTNRSKSPAGTAARTAQQRQAEAAAAKRAKELAALQTKQVKSQKALTDEQKKQNALKKAGSIFDLEQVQLIAALKGKLSDEDRKRVELQFALLTGNTSEAQKLTYEIAKAQGLGESLARHLADLPPAKNPFAAWEDYLDMLMAKARQVASVGGGAVVVAPMPSASIPAANVAAPYIGTPFGQAGSAAARALGTPFGQAGGNGSGYIGTPFGQAQPIIVQIDGKTIASAMQDQSLSGNNTTINRLGG
jgi:hypothetical protein